jgi:hypothetical protein
MAVRDRGLRRPEWVTVGDRLGRAFAEDDFDGMIALLQGDESALAEAGLT